MTDDGLYERVAKILEQARGQVARSVNTAMVRAYWLVGREIVEVEQAGEERASYGDEVIQRLSTRLAATHGKGFSVRNLRNMRQFLPSISRWFGPRHHSADTVCRIGPPDPADTVCPISGSDEPFEVARRIRLTRRDTAEPGAGWQKLRGGVPAAAVLVPLPRADAGRETDSARVLRDRGGARVLVGTAARAADRLAAVRAAREPPRPRGRPGARSARARGLQAHGRDQGSVRPRVPRSGVSRRRCTRGMSSRRLSTGSRRSCSRWARGSASSAGRSG